jgi:hypothetical protein
LGASSTSDSEKLRRETDTGVEWAWAMNAASSVLGSALAMVVAIRFGLNVTLLTGAVAYLLAVLLSPGLLKLRET